MILPTNNFALSSMGKSLVGKIIGFGFVFEQRLESRYTVPQILD